MNNDMATFFDRLAPEWDNAPSEYDKREKLTSMMGLPPNSVIADIGCGKGVMFEHLLKSKPLKIIAVDASSEMLRLAKIQFDDQRIHYVNDDLLDASLPMLDAAVIFNAYPHFLNKQALAGKLAQSIKNKGILIIAHSMGREALNVHHSGDSVSKLSTPLEAAEVEAGKFEDFFTTDVLIDNDEMYFIKMSRT